MEKRVPKPPPPPPKKKTNNNKTAASLREQINANRTHMYRCDKRSCRHTKDIVVHVTLRWIIETQRYCSEHILYFCINQPQGLNFFKLAKPTLTCPTKCPWPPDHRPLLTPPLSQSLTLLLQLFFSSLINCSWNQANSASNYLLCVHSGWKLKDVGFS